MARGYLREAIVNYIALLGWSPAGEREIYSLPELAEVFDLGGISKSASIFDEDKLRWMNGEYIRALAPEEFARRAAPWLEEALAGSSVSREGTLALLQPRLETLAQIPEKVGFLREMPEYDMALYTNKKMKTTPENSLDVLRAARKALAEAEFTNDALYGALTALAAKLELKNGRVLWPVRVAISGVAVTPGGATELAALLGREETLRRLDTSIAKLEAALG